MAGVRMFRVQSKWDPKLEGNCRAYHDHFEIDWDSGETQRGIMDLSDIGVSKVSELIIKSPQTIEASITLVEHGYQIDVWNYANSPDDHQSVTHSAQCRDFGGDYDIRDMANTVIAALIVAMETVEEQHREIVAARVANQKKRKG